jgi:lipocalin-like protein
LQGTWIVTEEYMGGGSTKTGKNCNYVRYVFENSTSGYYIKRDNAYSKEDPPKRFTWTLKGTKLKINKLGFTIKPDAGKRTMSWNGILGTKWKLRKK